MIICLLEASFMLPTKLSIRQTNVEINACKMRFSGVMEDGSLRGAFRWNDSNMAWYMKIFRTVLWLGRGSGQEEDGSKNKAESAVSSIGGRVGNLAKVGVTHCQKSPQDCCYFLSNLLLNWPHRRSSKTPPHTLLSSLLYSVRFQWWWDTGA